MKAGTRVLNKQVHTIRQPVSEETRDAMSAARASLFETPKGQELCRNQSKTKIGRGQLEENIAAKNNQSDNRFHEKTYNKYIQKKIDHPKHRDGGKRAPFVRLFETGPDLLTGNDRDKLKTKTRCFIKATLRGWPKRILS